MPQQLGFPPRVNHACICFELVRLFHTHCMGVRSSMLYGKCLLEVGTHRPKVCWSGTFPEVSASRRGVYADFLGGSIHLGGRICAAPECAAPAHFPWLVASFADPAKQTFLSCKSLKVSHRVSFAVPTVMCSFLQPFEFGSHTITHARETHEILEGFHMCSFCFTFWCGITEIGKFT